MIRRLFQKTYATKVSREFLSHMKIYVTLPTFQQMKRPGSLWFFLTTLSLSLFVPSLVSPQSIYVRQKPLELFDKSRLWIVIATLSLSRLEAAAPTGAPPFPGNQGHTAVRSSNLMT